MTSLSHFAVRRHARETDVDLAAPAVSSPMAGVQQKCAPVDRPWPRLTGLFDLRDDVVALAVRDHRAHGGAWVQRVPDRDAGFDARHQRRQQLVLH